jgi:hypothetical protein
MWEPFISSIRAGQADNAPVCGPNFEVTSVQPLVQRLHREPNLGGYTVSQVILKLTLLSPQEELTKNTCAPAGNFQVNCALN